MVRVTVNDDEFTQAVAERLVEELRRQGVRVVPGADKRRIDQMIAARLKHWGVRVSSGYQADRPEEFDVLVVYEDRWQWDMSTYLIELRDAKTNAPVATGHSYQPSLARKPPDEVVARVIDAMMSEAAASQ